MQSAWPLSMPALRLVHNMSELNSGVILAVGNDKDSDTPSAWVGCLGCYNSGALVGKWIAGNACDDLEAAGLTNSAGACVKCGADEFWVMDHENFDGMLSGECSPMEAYEAASQLDGVEEYEREILRAWLGNGMKFDLDAMREAYLGEYASDQEMAEEFAESCDLLGDMPESLRYYFDFEAYARDLMNDVWQFSGYYFWNR